MILAAVSEGHADFADVMFLVAFIIFIVGAIFAALLKPIAVWTVLLFAGLACISLAWLVL